MPTPLSVQQGFFLLMMLSLPIFIAHARVNPGIEWKKIETTNFELIYDAKQQPLAEDYARKLEAIYSELQPFWPELPTKTLTIINDRTDFSNGYATALPYPHMMIFPAIPSASESLADYGNWSHEILLHEYIHILSFEQRQGPVRGLSYIFGNIITPNLLMSRWSLEGAAVEAETRFSSHGRLRSFYQDAQIRAWVRAGRLREFDLNEINETSIPTWPYGSRPYIFGSLMWSQMNSASKGKLMGDLHQRMGGRAPYTIEGALIDLSGKDTRTWYEETVLEVEGRAQRQLAQLEQVPFTTSAPLVREGQKTDYLETLAPSISPDGLKLAFIARTETLKKSVQVWVRPSTAEAFDLRHSTRKLEGLEDVEGPSADPKIPRLDHEDAPAGSSIQRLSWFPNSEAFVFDQIEEQDPFSEWGDLWVYNLQEKKSKRLTSGLRAREPHVAPDGQIVAFVQLTPGSTQLSAWNVQSGSTEVLFTPELGERISHPLWLDQNRILFSLRRQGTDQLMVWQRGQAPQPVLDAYPNARFPQLTAEGILFISSKNGVPNLYRARTDFSEAVPVTHSATAVSQADEDPFQKEVFFTEMSDSGLNLRRMPSQTAISTTITDLPVISKLFEDRYPQRQLIGTNSSVTLSAPKDYSPAEYLLPRYWVPFVFWDEISTKVSVFTSAQDPLMKHFYSVSGLYDSKIKDWSGTLSYENRSFYPVLRTTFVDLRSPLGFSNEEQTLRGAVLSAEWPFLFGKSEWSLVTGLIGTDRSLDTASSKQWGPTVGVSYVNISQTAAQVSPEAGSTANLTVTPFQRGKDLTPFNLVSAGYTQYLSRWIPKRHAVMARVQGQYIDQTVSAANFESSITQPATASLGNTYLIRGYAPGTFLGKSLLNMNLEYRFPLRSIYQGWDAPLFFRRVTGAVVADGLYFRGFAYQQKEGSEGFVRQDGGRPFTSVGAEARLETTLGYHFPFAMIMGLHWPTNSELGHKDARLSLGISL